MVVHRWTRKLCSASPSWASSAKARFFYELDRLDATAVIFAGVCKEVGKPIEIEPTAVY
jgi:hypothetical protein